MRAYGRSRQVRRQTIWRFLAVTALVSAAIAAWIAGPASAANGFANPAFQTQWQAGEAITQNFWGPLQNARDGQNEPYLEAPGGQRLVQYFDKGRMELNNPSTGVVTSGLLATELITGKRQDGDNTFTTLQPAGVPVAGDPDNIGPTYASIGAAQLTTAAASTPGVGTTRSLSATGTVGVYSGASASDPQAAIATYDTDTQHNVAAAFSTFRTKVNLLNVGFAISEPFWSSVKVGGVQKDVLVQAFQRRVLTYTPTNPDAFKVEFGNIGQHYLSWRTSPGGNVTPTPSVTAIPTSVADTTAPKLSKVDTPYQTPYSFTVTWQTNEPASSEVKYGQTANYEALNDKLKGIFTYDHQVVISGLTPGGTYHFRIQSRDPVGNITVDDSDRALTLPAAAAVPKITNIVVFQKTPTTFTVTWATDVPAYSRIEYGLAGSAYDRFREGDNSNPLGTAHAATAISLLPSTVYNFRIVSALPADRHDASASDDAPTPFNGNTVQTNAVVAPLTVSSTLTATQAKPGALTEFTFSTDRPASVVIELGTTSKLGQFIYLYGAASDYAYPFTRNLHGISAFLPAGTWYYRVTAYDTQGVGASDVKSVTVT